MSSEIKLRLALLCLALTIVLGVIGYSAIEHWGLLDSLYMTVITLATVGFEEVRPLSDSGRIFTIVLIVFGAFTGAFVVSTAGQMVLEGQLRTILGKRKMEKKVQKLSDHVIVCGFGRVGRQVAAEFVRRQVSFVIIEQQGEVKSEAHCRDLLFVDGNAADEDVLEAAGIRRAKAVISTLPDDADNVYLALTARQLNPEIMIVARAESGVARKKLIRAGADKVVCPHELGGSQMAMATLRPNVVDFMRLASVVPGAEQLGIEEIAIKAGGKHSGKTIVEAAVKTSYDAIVIGLRKKSGEVQFNPPGEARMEDGDILIVLGESSKLEQLAVDMS